MGCVQLKQRHSTSANQSESLQCSNKQMIAQMRKQQVALDKEHPKQQQQLQLQQKQQSKQKYQQEDEEEEDPQQIKSLSNISEEKKSHVKSNQAKSCSSSKQTGVGETMKMDDHSISSKAAPVPRYSVTIEYVLARKSFVESQNIPSEYRLNMFPAPKLKGIEKSSLYYRRRSAHAELSRPHKFESTIQTRPAVKSHKF